MDIFLDRKFRLPRIWSNQELDKFAHLFGGDVANVSAWKDEDKQGGKYRDYFSQARSYTITNYKHEAMGFQGVEGEIFLDLTAELPQEFIGKFDTVFNHTVLEHIYDVKKAFANLCLMSREAVIIVVPFLQQMHTDYGDYWRFTPLNIESMFKEQGWNLQYLSFNEEAKASVYIFAIAVKDKLKWQGMVPDSIKMTSRKKTLDGFEPMAGCRAIGNLPYTIKRVAADVYGKLRRLGK